MVRVGSSFDGWLRKWCGLVPFAMGCTNGPAAGGPTVSVVPAPASVSKSVPGDRGELGPERVFFGMCDASGAVPIDDRTLLVADDEDNVLRVYDAERAGEPLRQIDVSQWLGLTAAAKADGKPAKVPESDIEAATRLGDTAYWITSHGRSSSGKFRPERLRLFATRISQGGLTVDWVGSYEHLLEDLLAEPRLARFELASAAERAPKDNGGLAIEGMTERLEGGVWIGFRNPVPAGRALVIALLNPEQVVKGGKPNFGEALPLDLQGYGVRSLSGWRGRYLVVGGHSDSKPGSALYTWNGRDQPVRVESLVLGDLNPEGVFSPEQRDAFMLLSDDGSRQISGKECKRLKDPAAKRFRGVWVRLG